MKGGEEDKLSETLSRPVKDAVADGLVAPAPDEAEKAPARAE